MQNNFLKQLEKLLEHKHLFEVDREIEENYNAYSKLNMEIIKKKIQKGKRNY